MQHVESYCFAMNTLFFVEGTNIKKEHKHEENAKGIVVAAFFIMFIIKHFVRFCFNFLFAIVSAMRSSRSITLETQRG